MRHLLIFILLFQMLDAQRIKIDWKKQTELAGFPENLGLAGMAAAKVENGFLLAGGANFPDLLPWEGGKKIYSDKIFLWDGSERAPEELALKLPIPAGYFGYVSFKDQLLIVGGETSEGASRKVYLLSQNHLTPLPDLPTAVTAPVLINTEGVIYLLGGDTASQTTRQFLTLDLSKNQWVKLSDLPVPTANAAAFFAQNHIYLASGRSKNPNGISTLNSEIFKYDLKTQKWEKETEILVNAKASPFVAPAFFTWKNRYLIFAGGDDGKTFHNIETLLSEISAAATAEQKETLTKQKNYLVKHHHGFNNKVLIYDAKSKKWLPEGYLPFPAQVTTASVAHQDHFYIISGETRPGIRSPKILMGTVK